MFEVLPYMTKTRGRQGKYAQIESHLLSSGATEECYGLVGETELRMKKSPEKQETKTMYGNEYNVQELG